LYFQKIEMLFVNISVGNPNQTNPKNRRMSSSTINMNNNKQTITGVTRSEATNLVELYLRATNNPLSEKSRKGKYSAPMATFRTMTQYQPRTGSSLNGKGPLDKYAFPSDMFFNTIKELIDAVGKKEPFRVTQKRIRTTFMQNIEKIQSLQILQFLSCAIDNYLQEKHEHIENVLGDNTYEDNTCSVCEWSGGDYFYYSTTYGLNRPVCSDCVFVDERKNEEEEVEEEVEMEVDEAEVKAQEAQEEEAEEEEEELYTNHTYFHQEYEMTPRTCPVCKYYGTGYFYYYEHDYEYSSEAYYKGPVCIDCHRIEHEKVIQETDEEASGDSDSDSDPDYVPSEDEETDEDDEHEDDEQEFIDAEKFFGCEGCQYEWRDGWQMGWKAAMKQIKKFAKQQNRSENIHIPECAYCGASHNLKKCGGICEGAVRYCSTLCQKKDWKEGHKQECWAKEE